ncbi:Membrane-associated progesterone receptor component 2 [Papilio machaon]|uniref:Membrane-associated progesterone receptor component 2 n=1 Tax=Papilio machaon TaxID=76193 RepID=A0A194R3V4_PAPMA|nr:membrane-associated progesterone receptor component 1 [Papilio machaon]KPJ10521.1 Membrane-associated progesterone receptor component 2 [Papilio machaon]
MESSPEIKTPEPESSTASNIFFELIYSPVNILLTVIIVVLVYKIYKSKSTKVAAELPELPKLRKDMTVAELRQYDGSQPDGRVLVAVNGWIFDVTRGRRFYGPGGPYAAFGGKDASRGLATFSVTSSDKEYDDLSDLNSMEMDSVKEWEAQFREKYELVGKLLKPGEEPTSYSDEEVEESDIEKKKEK